MIRIIKHAVRTFLGLDDTPSSYSGKSGKASVVNPGEDGLEFNAPAPTAHKSTHEDGGADEISVTGLSGDLADEQDPKAHASEHKDGGVDELDISELAAALGTANQVPKSDGAAASWGNVAHSEVTGVSKDQHHNEDHSARHENGGADEVNVGGLSGELADEQKSNYLKLSDTPSSYAGEGKKLLRVNAAEDGLEFIADSILARATQPVNSNGNTFSTIQAAINDIVEGWVYVPTGTYDESISIGANKTVYLNSGVTINAQAGNYGVSLGSNSKLIGIGGGTQCTIDGGTENHAIYIYAYHVVVKSVTVTTSAGSGNNYDGIYLAGNENITLENVMVDYTDRHGIMLASGCRDVKIIKCRSAGHCDNDFLHIDGNGCIIMENLCYGTVSTEVIDGDNNVMVGNTNTNITDNGTGNDIAHNT